MSFGEAKGLPGSACSLSRASSGGLGNLPGRFCVVEGGGSKPPNIRSTADIAEADWRLAPAELQGVSLHKRLVFLRITGQVPRMLLTSRSSGLRWSAQRQRKARSCGCQSPA